MDRLNLLVGQLNGFMKYTWYIANIHIASVIFHGWLKEELKLILRY